MRIHARTLTVKASCIQMLETELTTDVSWNDEASEALAYEYSAAVLCMRKQYDWEHGPIQGRVLGLGKRSCLVTIADPEICPRWAR